MGDLIVKPSYQLSERDILTVDKINLMATPVVELALEDPVNDQNFFRNGNFYSSFWTTPAGISCPVGAWTTNASYWLCNPLGAAVNFLRSSSVPDLYSLFSAEIQGAPSVTDVEFGQQINGDLCATMRRNVTFSGYMYNATGLVVSPKLKVYTADVFNNFATITLQTTVNLQSGPDSSWTYITATLDLTLTPNIANGMLVSIVIPGALNAATKYVLFSRLKIQIGEVATEFVDDTSLFVQAPSVDSTMLQDGCIARPGLFQPNVIPAGAYQAKSINNGDINDGAIDSRTLVSSVSTTLSAPGFTQPAVATTVPIVVSSTVGFVANQPIIITGGGAYTVFSITDATHMVVTNTGATGNVAPATSVPAGGAVNQASAAVTNLGFTPINKAGDLGIGPAPLAFNNEVAVGAPSYQSAAAIVQGTAANSANDGYMPAISFHRPTKVARAIGLDINGKFKTVDSGGTVGYLLDSVTKVDTNSYQNGSITYQKLAQSVIDLLVPIGTVHLFAGVAPPGGWFVCNGAAVSRTTYSALFAQLGAYWGNGDGVSTFNIPNFINRVPVGYGTGASWGFGSYAGESSHQLSIAEMPGHDHGWSQSPHDHGTHAHNLNGPVPIGAGNTLASGNQWLLGGSTTDAQRVPPANANINFVGQGGWQAHNNMQPFGVLYYIIKAV